MRRYINRRTEVKVAHHPRSPSLASRIRPWYARLGVELTVQPNPSIRRRTSRNGKVFQGMLVAVAIFAVGCCSSNLARYGAAKTQIGAFSEALEMFRASCGRYPTTGEGLAALVVCPTNVPPDHWRQYLDAIPLDPWSHPYVYRLPGRHNTKSFDIYSCGADGITRSAGDDYDDVNNWNPASPRDPDRKSNLASLEWFGGAFFLSLLALVYCWRIAKPVGNLHGLAAVTWVLGVATLDYSIHFLGLSELAAGRIERSLLVSLVIAGALAISGLRRGCRISRVCGWSLALLLLLFLFLVLFMPRLAGV